MTKKETTNVSLTNISPVSYGVSFSAKQCNNFGIDQEKVLKWLISKGFRRFRLMTYWDDCQPTPEFHDFAKLDKQLKIIKKHGGIVSLCLGARQPRWPESHWPDWAWNLPKNERDEALLKFIETVIKRYKNNEIIISYQLENEALLGQFGERSEVDRRRLIKEFKLVKMLDSSRPIIMTTSTSWGIPLRRPIPDIVGFSYYQVLFNPKMQKYTTAFHKPFLDQLRTWAIKIIFNKPSFIHELQLEPWGPKAIWEMDIKEQNKSMNPDQIRKNLSLAHKTGLKSMDLWGGEWWYYRTVIQKDPSIWQAVKTGLEQG